MLPIERSGAETSVRRRFLGSSQSKPLTCLRLFTWGIETRSTIAGREIIAGHPFALGRRSPVGTAREDRAFYPVDEVIE